MIFVARVRSFFVSALGKRILSAVVIAAMMTALYTVPQRVLAQGTPAPGAAPAPAAAATAPAATGQGVTLNGYQQVWANTSSVTSCTVTGNTGACIVQILGLMITFLFSVITYFLSKLVILLTSILIVFARYNKFNNAPPVEIGWVVIRDVVNMFFIVILLASAFMTIIGQAESKGLHYTKVLPGIITGAILVNFSRTLMLLAIDASQVVTLTFISAFEGSIAGNIFQALGITRMTQLQSQQATGTGAEAVVSLVNIAIAYLLAIFLLTTAVAMILLYVGYFIFRIIGLWILIILSPIAFVAGSMPKVFGSMFTHLQKQFDARFTALLTGGPMIAFFLWLSFATIQRQSATDGLSGADMGFDAPADLAPLGFITQIGTTGDLAGFIVAVVLLGVGFSVATSTAGSVSPILETAGKKLKGYRDTSFGFIRGLPGRGTSAGARYVNQRYGLTNKISQGIARGAAGQQTQGFLQTAGGLVGRATSAVPGVGGGWAAAAAAGVAGVGVAGYAATRKDADARIKSLDSLPPAERIAAIRGLDMPDGDGKYSSLTNRANAEAQHEALVKNRDADLKARQSSAAERIQSDMFKLQQAEDRAAGVPVRTELSEDKKQDANRQAKALATRQLQDDEAQRAERLRGFADAARDTEAVDKIDKENKKSMRFTDPAKYEARVRELLANPEQLKEIDSEQLRSGRFVSALLREQGVNADPATGTIERTRLDSLKESVKDQKELVATIDAAVKQIEGGGATRASLDASVRQRDGFGVERLYSTQGNGEPLYSAKEQAAMAQLNASGATARTHGTPLNNAQRSAVKLAIDNKLPIAQIMRMVDKEDPATGASDNTVLEELGAIASSLATTATTDPAEALKKLAQYLKIAKEDGNATGDQMASIMNSVMTNNGMIDRLFENYNKMSKKQQGDANKILSYMVQVEDSNSAIKDRLTYTRDERFPPTKQKVQKRDYSGTLLIDPTTGAKIEEERGRSSALNAILSQ